MNAIARLRRQLVTHRYGFTLFAFLIAAAVAGVACVGFMRCFEWVWHHRMDAARIGVWHWLAAPALFLVASLLLRLAPEAEGTGIPQAVFAAGQMTPQNAARLHPLISYRTILVKVAVLLIALLGGASTGREGPSVHVAVCVFMSVLFLMQRLVAFNLDLRSAIIAGGAAGLAAAFNTPLAGVVFAIEELTAGYFGHIKDYVLMAIIVAALAAKSLTGEYSYFGRMVEPAAISLFSAFLIGVVAGGAGAFFSKALLAGGQTFRRLRERPYLRWVIPLLCGLGVQALAYIGGENVLGPGNTAAKQLIAADFGPWALLYPVLKMGATCLTYFAGGAGGFFAPCLAIGAAIGSSLGAGLGVPVAGGALAGMAAFLAGTIQAPMTAFVIIFEMTGHHWMLLPIMVSALTAYMTARLLRVPHLYQALAQRFDYLINKP